jgi:hypothetical protein
VNRCFGVTSPLSSGSEGKPRQQIRGCGFFLCLLLNPESEANLFSETSVGFHRTTRRCIPDDGAFHIPKGLRSGNVLDSYSGGDRFKSRPGNRLSVLRFVVIFHSTSRQIPEWNLDKVKTTSFPNHSQMMIHLSCIHSTLHILATENIIK